MVDRAETERTFTQPLPRPATLVSVVVESYADEHGFERRRISVDADVAGFPNEAACKAAIITIIEAAVAGARL